MTRKHAIRYTNIGQNPMCACGYDPARFGRASFYKEVTMVATVPHPITWMQIPAWVKPDEFRCVWPVLDPDRRRQDLIDEATEDLPARLKQAGAALVGPVAWEVEYNPSFDRYTLVATAPAIPYESRAGEKVQ